MTSSHGTMDAMISAIVLTHNNEITLKRTLNSLRFADELIVLDDFSSDKTVPIAKQCKATVISRHVGADFAAQRNFGLKRARGNWVLFVDSDEIVTEALKKEILQKIETPHVAGYYLNRTDVFFRKKLMHGETGNIRLLRLARKDAGFWRQPVHEVWEIDGPTANLCEPLIHYPHQSVGQFLTDINQYSTIYAKHLYLHKKHEPALYIIGLPLAKFVVNYFIRLGFLDGMQGMIVAVMMSFHSFLVRAKLFMLWQTRGDST